MEKKNTILLTVIAVATLLVAVVGATFAYFTAAATGTGTGTASTGTTANVGDNEIALTHTGDTADVAYPGGLMVAGAKIEATTTGANTLNAAYTLNATVDTTGLSAGTSVKWTIYESDTAVTENLVTGCKLVEEPLADQPNVKKYYYEADSCKLATGIKGTEVQSATITDHSNVTNINLNEALNGVTATTAKTTYYYLVVEYINADTAQNDDQGATISAQFVTPTNPVFTTAS